MGEPIYLEVGTKRVFACSLHWPGWCRSGRDEGAAIEALATYADRYADVAVRAGLDFPSKPALDVVDRRRGTGETDFGAPGAISAADVEPLTGDDAKRQAALMAAAWRVFEDVVAGAPVELRKGPRGGGRDRDQVVEHVHESERAYARTLGVRYTPTMFAEPGGPAAMRGEILEVVRGERQPDIRGKGWPLRYAARRIAWHVLDHAWEIEDKSA